MFIGRLAQLTGCTPKAIRLYEQLGLISEPQRSGRYRVYNPHHVQMVQLIRKAQTAGFKLAEMGPLIAAKNALRAFPLDLANAAVDAKRLDVQARIRELQALDVHLAGLKCQMNELFIPHTAAPRACPDTQTLRATPAAAGAD
jgi:MerR family transcriptional regulator, copper efflux regulator